MKLLTREEFKRLALERDNGLCVICHEKADTIHHILERRLWGDSGGYFLCNGASVCCECHIKAETTEISVEMIRSAAKIEKWIIPDHLYEDSIYDKWGNIIQSNGTRLRGELFFDESVQKILKQGGVLDLFTNRVKYPRSYHVKWSEGMNEDDRQHENMDNFVGKEVVVTTKMDGENCVGGDTIINTIDGKKTIKNIVNEKLETGVLSYNHYTNEIEYRKITDHHVNLIQDEDWYEIVTIDGKILSLSGNHRVYIPILGCYREVKHLKEGDLIEII